MNLHKLRIPGNAVESSARQFAAQFLVEYVEPDRIRQVSTAAPNDTSYASQWALQTVQALQAWGAMPNAYLTSAGAGAGRIKVAVIDTGIDCTHPDFANAGGSSTDSAQGGQLLFSAGRAFVATSISSPVCSWQDDHGHGTHVAGTVAAATNNSRGVSALGYPLQIIGMKVLDRSGSGFDSDVSDAIMAAADAGAQIISLSLGGTGYSQALQDAIRYAWQRNSLVVAAAGNAGSSTPSFPAAANFAVGVSATTSANALASFSSFGDPIDIAAPGVSILSTVPTYATTIGVLNYASMSGTSMATPHVSALAGLVAMTTPGTSAAAVLERIQQSASSSTVSGGWSSSFGYGIINAYNALTGSFRGSTIGGIVGQVTDSANLPVTTARVTLNGQTLTVGSGGLFRFPALVPGTYPIAISATGYPTQNLTATVVPGADTTLDVMLGVSYGKFTGVARDNGIAVAGAVVQALSGGLVWETTFTDQSGNYNLWVPGGTYDLRVTGISRAAATVSRRSVAAGGSTAVDLAAARYGWIAGRVTDSTGQPVQDAEVTVSGGGFSAGATTDSSGNYTTIGLPSGAYSVAATAAGYPAAVPQNGVVSPGLATTANFTLSAAAFTSIRVNAGGGAYTDPSGNLWAPDTGYSGGSTWSTPAGIANTTTPPLYQSERFGTSALQYQFNGIPAGTYTVKLKFAEIWFGSPGQRVFNIALNSQTVQTGFDIVAAAGGAFRAVDLSFPVTVSAGQIVIRLTAVVENPKISAIEIVPAGGNPIAVSVSPASASLGASQSRQFTATVTGTANTAVTWSLSPAVGTVSAAGLYTAPATVDDSANGDRDGHQRGGPDQDGEWSGDAGAGGGGGR